jgi:hypothetical protein
LKRDKSACLNWLSTFPESPLCRSLSAELGAQLVRDGDVNSALSLRLIPFLSEDGGCIDRVVAAQSKSDPLGAADWILRLPPETDVGDLADSAMESWLSLDASGAAAWVEKLPRGKRRDRFTLAYVNAASQRDPRTAQEWVKAIDDPTIRRIAYRRVADELSEVNRGEAIGWIRGVSELDERYRDAAIRSLRRLP